MKSYIRLLLAVVIPNLCIAQNGVSYYKGTDMPPGAEYYRQQMAEQILKRMDNIDWTHIERRTSGSSVIYIIPVVVHVLHNYGPEMVKDDSIYNLIASINTYFLKRNPDTASIIDKFKPIAASTQIEFKLATIDPDGNQTKGIEHIFTYLTYMAHFAPDQSKINQWPPDKYLNLWLVNSAGGDITVAAGHSYGSYSAAYFPYYDGIYMASFFCSYPTVGTQFMAKYLNLPYPCSIGFCGDADLIPDTPPCDGLTHYMCTDIYDSACDTPNVQNMMINLDDNCQLMFTYGQGQYMQYILQIDIGHRDSLVTPHNFSATGMDKPMPDMLPVADFSIKGSSNNPTYFFCEDQNVHFYNQSWNDTIVGASWTFSNGAAIPVSSSLTSVVNKFYEPGWATVSLAVDGNNTGTSTFTNKQALYIADTVPTNADGYYQEFSSRGAMNKWPIFNYYNNNFKWEVANAGCFDNMSLEYLGFDGRPFPENKTGGPFGDYDDVFTPVFDLTYIGATCFLNFWSSGASATSDPFYMRDTLEIDYSTNGSSSWTVLGTLSGADLANKGALSVPYRPLWSGDWVPRAYPLPSGAITRHTIFRFRYHPGADSSGTSTGNNFYLDRFNIRAIPESAGTLAVGADGAMLYPNPTHGDASVIVSGDTGGKKVRISVNDITGKAVFETCNTVYGNSVQIAIPRHAIAGKGVYVVHIITDKLNKAEKLVVY